MTDKIRYCIYPSLLDKFSMYLASDEEFESFFNIDADGEYKQSAEEIEARLEQELIDAINRVKTPPTEAADAGTVLNEIIDRLILGQKEGRSDVEAHSSKVFVTRDGETLPMPCIYGFMDGFQFCFDLDLCKELRDYLSDAIPQCRVEAVLPTKYGNVLLYGYADYVCMDRVIDLKTTSVYDFGKFGDRSQKEVYPYCLFKSGEMTEVNEFEYLVCKWKKSVNAPWRAEIYKETYSIDMERLEESLRGRVETFVEFLERNRHRITDRKIFGGEN